MSDSSRPHGLQPTRLLRPWDFPGKSTGVGCHCLLHYMMLQLVNYLVNNTQSCPTLCNPVDCSPPGSSFHGILQARILEWEAIAFSRGSSPSWNRTRISCIAGRFFTVCATREAAPQDGPNQSWEENQERETSAPPTRLLGSPTSQAYPPPGGHCVPHP